MAGALVLLLFGLNHVTVVLDNGLEVEQGDLCDKHGWPKF